MITGEEKIRKITKVNNAECDGVTFLDLKIVEEYGEFLQALFKYDRDQDAFIEELADVIIVTRQLMETLDDEQEKRLDELIEFKLNRTLERLKIND